MYRPEIDGLRALAVIPVILFHAGFSAFSGGFVGVDIFFVISGYLITGILIRELEEQNFSIITFYERRARRILPALYFVILICVPFAWAWMLPEDLKDFFQSIVAVLFFASNVLFFTENGYFDGPSEEKPLLHTWSLAVEEQYYIFFPLLLLLLWRFGKRPVFHVLTVFALFSLVLSELTWRTNPDANFFLAHTRAWELLAGALAAFYVSKAGVKDSNTLSSIGLIVILASIFLYDDSIPFPSVYALLPVLGTVCLILFAHPKTMVFYLLSRPVFVGIGLISYSAYLWHQPILVFLKMRMLHEPNTAILLIACIATFVLAFLSWKYIEQPFRSKTKVPKLLFTQVIGGTFLLLLCVGLLGHFKQGFPDRDANGISYLELDSVMQNNLGLSALCEHKFTTVSECESASNPEIVLWGDSLAMHLAQGLGASGKGFRQHTLSACAPVLDVAQFDIQKNREWGQDCIKFNNQVMSWIKNNSIQTVILASPFKDIVNMDLQTVDGEIIERSFEKAKLSVLNTVQTLRESGARVVIVSPTPTPIGDWDVGACLVKQKIYNASIDSCNFELNLTTSPLQLLREVEGEVPIYWLHEDICSENICQAQIDDVLMFRDAIHLTKEGSLFLGKNNRWMEKLEAMAK